MKLDRSSREAAAAEAERPTAREERDAIATEGLVKVYLGGVTAVDGLDLSVHAGEIFGLLGPNGAGKTTTVGMLTTRIVPTSGRAWVGGVDVIADPPGARAIIGVVSQHNTLDRGLTAWENLFFHGRYFGMRTHAARSAADRWLEAFQLAEKADALVRTLSGGMARRLILARAMLHGPSVLFLDEPTAGLDPQSRLALWDIINGLRATGQTVLLTTHYIEEADRFCDRVAIVDHGHILALDTPQALKRSFGARPVVTLKVEGDAAALARLLSSLEGISSPQVTEEGVRAQVETSDRALPKVIAAAERKGFRVTDASVSEDSLENVFISLTGRELRE